MQSTNLSYIWLLLWVVLLFIKGIIPGWQKGRSDFSNYYTSSVLLKKGESISKFYDNLWFEKEAKLNGVVEGAKFAPFTPFTAYCFLPLSFFSEIVAKRIWLIFNLLLLALAFFLIQKRLHLTREHILWMLFIFFTPLASNIRLGQIYLGMAVTLLISIFYLVEKRNWFFESIISALTVVKIFPAVFILYRLKSRGNTFVAFVLCSTALLLLLIMHQGTDVIHNYWLVFVNHFNGSLSGQEIHSFNYQSIDSLLSYLFVFDSRYNPSPFLDFPILKTIIKYAFLLSVCASCIWVYMKSTIKDWGIKESVVIIGISLIFPATATYHFLLLLVPFLLLLPSISKRNNGIKFLLLSVLTFNVLPHHIPELASYGILNVLIHYPRFWGLLILFSYLCFVFLKKEEANG